MLATAIRLRCTLLTGDKALRTLADQEGVDVKGTVWVLSELVVTKVISCETAWAAVRQMGDKGRRLPWDALREQLIAVGCSDEPLR